jgi:hypothetical protein
MWNFGADASVEYTRENFSTTWNIGKNALIQTYSKEHEEMIKPEYVWNVRSILTYLAETI